MKSLPGTFTRKASILSHECDGEFVLYDPGRDAVHTLNATAQFIWAHCEQSPEEIARALQATYQVSNDSALADVERVLARFKTLGIVRQGS